MLEQSYKSDTSKFTEKDFEDKVAKSNQIITFYGVGAHHQNSLIECCINKIITWDQVILLHTKRF